MVLGFGFWFSGRALRAIRTAHGRPPAPGTRSPATRRASETRRWPASLAPATRFEGSTEYRGRVTAVAFALAGLALLRYAYAVPRLVRWFRRARVASIPKGETPPLTLLKPLYGRDPGLSDNLVATLRQNYPDFEVLFLHERPDEPALTDAWEATAQVPDVPVRLVPGRDPDAANPKVAVLLQGEAEARHDILVAADSDVRPDPLYLRDVANALAEADAVTFAPVMFGMRTFWARVVGLAVDTDAFLGIVALDGRATVGATIGVRREALARAGGWRAVADRMADDYALGQALQREGCTVALARRAVRLHHPGGDFEETARWMQRWTRTIRAAAPGWFVLAGAVALAPLALLLAAVATPYAAAALWLLVLLTAVRAAIAVAVDFRFCWDRSLVRSLPMLPLLWFLEPAALAAGLFGRVVTWRGRRYRIKRGRATLLDS